MSFATYFNATAYTVNLSVAKFPYVTHYDHNHDVECFIKNQNKLNLEKCFYFVIIIKSFL
jgi:hypothetical protein